MNLNQDTVPHHSYMNKVVSKEFGVYELGYYWSVNNVVAVFFTFIVKNVPWNKSSLDYVRLIFQFKARFCSFYSSLWLYLKLIVPFSSERLIASRNGKFARFSCSWSSYDKRRKRSLSIFVMSLVKGSVLILRHDGGSRSFVARPKALEMTTVVVGFPMLTASIWELWSTKRHAQLVERLL